MTRLRCTLAGLALLAALGFGRTAFAQDTHTPATHGEETVPRSEVGADAPISPNEIPDEEAGEGGHGGGMPQLNAHTYPSQIFWLVVAFGGLYMLLKRRALPRVGEILEARQERISGDLDRAAKLREEAEAAQRGYEEVVAKAQGRSADEIKAVQDRVMADVAKRQAELDADLARQLDEAETRIMTSREQALAQIENVAVQVAQAAVQRLAGLSLNEADVKSALDQIKAEAA